jgi:hypothetical protein
MQKEDDTKLHATLAQYTLFKNITVKVHIRKIMRPAMYYFTRDYDQAHLDYLRTIITHESYDPNIFQCCVMPYWANKAYPAPLLDDPSKLTGYNLWAVGGMHGAMIVNELYTTFREDRFKYVPVRVCSPKFFEDCTQIGTLHQALTHAGKNYDNIDIIFFINREWEKINRSDMPTLVRNVSRAWYAPQERYQTNFVSNLLVCYPT